MKDRKIEGGREREKKNRVREGRRKDARTLNMASKTTKGITVQRGVLN